ncbi:hypothetical protein K402DRAFT_424252 [Aulographum hederae CBS 113979]|uniref:Uncharacterized protein n=1 Tax=Aulographum hederae CBS 113979 TaxID=1176131 RepID=A0A6G1GPW3_9PEZI|nr:hypothetical protein K402DRAFT_424252 [Aulographum hederae CBS 113979]
MALSQNQRGDARNAPTIQLPTREELYRTIFVGNITEGVGGDEILERLLRATGSGPGKSQAKERKDKMATIHGALKNATRTVLSVGPDQPAGAGWQKEDVWTWLEYAGKLQKLRMSRGGMILTDVGIILCVITPVLFQLLYLSDFPNGV